MENLYDDPRLFGRFMFRLRREYGWSRKFLAKELGFNSESSVMNFETGHTTMKPKYISRFCKITPNKLSVPIVYAMFEAASIKPPCKCPCHYDMGDAIPRIYDDDGKCRYCAHVGGDCEIMNGLWFETNKENYYDQSA